MSQADITSIIQELKKGKSSNLLLGESNFFQFVLSLTGIKIFLKYGRQGAPHNRLFKVSEDESAITASQESSSPKSWFKPFGEKVVDWIPTHTVSLADVVAVQRGQNTPVFARYATEKTDDLNNRSISILFNPNRSLDFICPTVELANTWFAGITALHNAAMAKLIADPEVELCKSQWKIADKDNSGAVDLKEVTQLLDRLNVATTAAETKKIFDSLDADHSNNLNFEEFMALREKLLEKPEFKELFSKYSTESGNKSFITLENFKNFSETEQNEKTNDNEIKDLFANTKIGLSPSAFYSYLSSNKNSAYSKSSLALHQNMNRPMAEYFIFSSHNTYLTGDQLTSESSVLAYVNALKQGCRCVELDVWDGPNGQPIITHATSKILFEDVIKSIKDHAFMATPYPLLLSIELHASFKQQQRMAEILKEQLGEMLQHGPKEKVVELPSPEHFKNKILIKGKRLKNAESTEVSDDEEDEEDEKKEKPKEKPKIAPELSELVYLAASKFDGFKDDLDYDCAMISSFSEGKIEKMIKKNPKELMRMHSKKTSRIYPSGSIINCITNSCQVVELTHLIMIQCLVGAQVVALNVQSFDKSTILNYGLFLQNGRTGYVLKPALENEQKTPKKLEITIISAQQLPKPNFATKGEIVDPFVQLSVHGRPEDCKVVKTRVVDNNGFHPIWQEKFEFSVTDTTFASLIFIVFDQDTIKNDTIAGASIPISCLRPGFRWVQLYGVAFDPLPGSGILIHSKLI